MLLFSIVLWFLASFAGLSSANFACNPQTARPADNSTIAAADLANVLVPCEPEGTCLFRKSRAKVRRQSLICPDDSTCITSPSNQLACFNTRTGDFMLQGGTCGNAFSNAVTPCGQAANGGQTTAGAPGATSSNSASPSGGSRNQPPPAPAPGEGQRGGAPANPEAPPPPPAAPGRPRPASPASEGAATITSGVSRGLPTATRPAGGNQPSLIGPPTGDIARPTETSSSFIQDQGGTSGALPNSRWARLALEKTLGIWTVFYFGYLLHL